MLLKRVKEPPFIGFVEFEAKKNHTGWARDPLNSLCVLCNETQEPKRASQKFDHFSYK